MGSTTGFPGRDDTTLLFRVAPGQAALAAEIAGAHRAGLVLTGPRPEPTVRWLTERGFPGPVLCDRMRYAGRSPIAAWAGLTPHWCPDLRRLGAVVLTDSGFCPAGDVTGLRTVLGQAVRQPGPAIAVLGLAAEWFTDPASTPLLVREVVAHDVPVAVSVVGGAPAGRVREVLRGLAGLLRVEAVPVTVLHHDPYAVGLLCLGAHAATVDLDAAGPPEGPVTAFVPALLTHVDVDTLAGIEDRTPHLAQFWDCACEHCGGRPLSALARTGDPARRRARALRHSAHAVARWWADTIRADRTGGERVRSWQEATDHALTLHREMAEVWPGWRPPPALLEHHELARQAVRATAPPPSAAPGAASTAAHVFEPGPDDRAG